MKPVFVGLDLGTSSVKAGLYNLRGKELAMVQEPLSIDFPAADRAEQDAGEWSLAVQKVLNRLSQCDFSGKVQAVGLSAQCPGHVLVDNHTDPLGPAIIWCDQRAHHEAAWLAKHIPAHTACEWVGSNSLGDMTTSPARLLWLKNNRPLDWQRADKILQPKDFIGLLLTGRAVTDGATAYLLAHPDSNTYHPDFLAFLGIEENQLPQVKSPTTLLGVISKQAAALTHVADGTPVFTGTIDAYCDILAGGGIQPGHAVDVAGTSEIISLGTACRQQGDGVFLAHIEEEGSFLCGPTQSSCNLLRWAVDTFYPDMGGIPDYNILESEAIEAGSGADGMLFLPYLRGERAPLWDQYVRAAFLQVNGRHRRPHFMRAVYESIGFSVRHVLETCEKVSNRQACLLVICGGGSRSRFWNQVKANILQRQLHPIQTVNSACLGAAMLAATGAGYFSGLTPACKDMIHLGRPVMPEPEYKEIYNVRYSQYRNAYPAIRKVNQEDKGISE